MSAGVGYLKREFAYDLNAAKYSYNSGTLDYSIEIKGILFFFTSVTPKTVTITLQDNSSGTLYNIGRWSKKVNTQVYMWINPLDLPQSVRINVEVTKTTAACLMNMVIIRR